ncbi:MAG: hypothetical protein KDD37_00605 [Bdellovibrionales bacterium]|nr:hypothetical protein [Bdellovibrionales bacterium]
MLITFLLQTTLIFAGDIKEQKYETMLASLRQGEIVTCIDDCKKDYALFLHALDQYYEIDKPSQPINAPLYPDSGLLLSYYMIVKDHFPNLTIPQKLYDSFQREFTGDSNSLHPVIKKLSESDPFFMQYIRWVSEDNLSQKDFDVQSIRSLVSGARKINLFKQGKYTNGIQIYKFCRSQRIYPCRLIVRDKDGNFARTASGKIWSIPSLALAANRKPYYQISGNTPSGIYTIDSVMPTADQTRSFGLYRRLILNFIPKALNEQNHLYLLPNSHQQQTWWREAVTARDVGRDLLRIHGTGKIVTKPSDPYYTFAPTQGCINTRENTYGNVTFNDQRLLLDASMIMLKLPTQYANETKINGLLYVINVDNKEAAVSTSDLEAWGLK